MMDGVRNCVYGYADLQNGEDFLIIAEFSVDPIVIQAFAAVASEAGADVSIMHIKPFSLGGKDLENPSDVVVGAYANADVCINCSFFSQLHSKKLGLEALGVLPGMSKKFKTRVVELAQTATVECLSSPGARFPLPLFYEIAKRDRKRVEAGKEMRITSPNGTDLRAEIGNIISHMEKPGPLLGKGDWRIFPLGCTGLVPPIKGDGVIFFEESYITGRPEDPVKLEIEKNRCTKIIGGRDADHLQCFMKNAPIGERAYDLCEIMWGLNPKARFKGAPQIERERHATTLHLALGPHYTHIDFMIDTPTIYIDDEIVVKNRKLLLLDDPELREIAEEFGDPDVLLSPFSNV
jgi:hypothetical protein